MRVLVTGAGGQLGRDLVEVLHGHDALFLTRDALDVTDPVAVDGVVASAMPEAIVHAAAWTDVDACEADAERARRVHVEGTLNVVEAAREALVVIVSTDYVFDGTLGRAYVETDPPNPLQVYGRTKLEAEQAARAVSDRVAVVRTAWLYGARTSSGEPARNFVASILRAAAHGPLDVVDDQVGSPTATADLARALVSLLEAGSSGLFHVVNAGTVSRYEFARAIVSGAGGDASLVRAVKTSEVPARAAARPAYAPLDGYAWREAGFDYLPAWDDALERALPGFLEIAR